MTSTQTAPAVKYLAEQAAAIDEAEASYRAALVDLQANRPHMTVLRHQDCDYMAFRVCEDCGVSCRAQWDSPVHVRKDGEASLMGKRYYSVSWSQYARALPRTLNSDHSDDED